MKYSNTFVASVTVALLVTGCVKPVADKQVVYDNPQPAQPTYEEAAPIVYEDTAVPADSGVIYSELPADETVITTENTTVNPGTPVYTNPYETAGASYPDPYGGQSSATSYPAATNYPTSINYPEATSYPSAPTTSYPQPTPQGSGISLQVAALKNYYSAEEFKNSLTLSPGQSVYVQKGPMNKVIVTGISSMSEANRLKESRFPGAFVVSGGQSGGYTPPVSPAYDTGSGSGAYNVDYPYGGGATSSASTGGSGIGVQVGAFSSRSKAQSVANSHGGRHSATVKKVGRLYKVILTGFSSRSAARAYASRVGGFVTTY